MTTRRAALAGLGGGLLTMPTGPFAQQPKRGARIGVLVSSLFFYARFEAFRKGLLDLGYVEGQNVAFEFRNLEGRFDRLSERAAELARAKVDLIFTASDESVLIAMKAAATIPIVFGTVQDPVASGIAASLSRPGKNAT